MKKIETLEGPRGTAVGLEPEEADIEQPGHQTTVRFYFITAPGQSVLWSHYGLGMIHLRDVEGMPPATITVPHATHQIMLYAMDPDRKPRADDWHTWSALRPINFSDQYELPSDEAAKEMLHLAARAIVNGVLWAEPALSGQKEPWQTSLIRTAAHLRGEEHADGQG